MTVPERGSWSIMGALENALKAWPDQRVAQVIVNAAGTNDPFYVEDHELEERLWAYAAHSVDIPS